MAAQLKKLLHIDMIVDASIGWDVLSLVDGKAMQMNVRPVKHGGQDEVTGELRAPPTGKEIVLALAGSREQFTTTELNEHAQSVGIGRTTCAAALHAMLREGVIKRFAPMTYGFSAKTVKANGAEHRPNKKKGVPLGLQPGSTPSKIVAAVREKQNGSGAGVPISVIKEMIGAKNNNISPQIFDLVQAKRLIRVGKGEYRVGEGA